MGRPAPGLSSGAGIAAMEELSKKVLPQGMRYEWSGLSLEEIESGGKAAILFGLGLVFVYLTLAAQYESYVLPFIVMLCVPGALLGALGALWTRGLSNDVYCQIGLVMLIGLASKNAILIVEFAEQLQEKGLSTLDAAVEAARIRLRPILMTSMAFILGVCAAGHCRRRRGGRPRFRGNNGTRRNDRSDHPESALHSHDVCDRAEDCAAQETGGSCGLSPGRKPVWAA